MRVGRTHVAVWHFARPSLQAQSISARALGAAKLWLRLVARSGLTAYDASTPRSVAAIDRGGTNAGKAIL